MIRNASTARRAARPFDYDDAERRGMTREAMAGLWTLRYGPFGCRDDETAGGVLHIEGDRIAGGDGYFIVHGRFDICDGGIDVIGQAIRHKAGSPFDATFDRPEPIFPVVFHAEAITRDHLEGLIKQPGFPARRVVMRRFGPLAPGSQLV